ncbi:far upstream element-binding protein 1-like [Octopus sinensis]|uniref:Far upstream element-binding protein 1-like n=1 Tax=Octopus sinensis TaxID=2607531 RepID=A0A7E6EIW1_9MOLL|nr:far upstream element-binding protein 1-like [Octopus sinensis]
MADLLAKLTLSQRLQEIGVYSFPFTDISQLDLRRGEELDEYKIPEDIITYSYQFGCKPSVVGKKCEQIDRLKKETGCKIYIESEVREGNTDVLVALVGSRENLRKAKGSMDIVVAKGRILCSAAKNSPFGADTGEAVEIFIPGSMAGLIIGKNGETIKSISTGARMIMIQDNSVPTINDKPLRITGEVHQVQAALKLVNELMATREADTSIARKYTCECYKLSIANEKCGIAIGRGGETIREINEESGALVEISKMIPPNDYEKEFNIWGTRDEVISAVQMICSRTQTLADMAAYYSSMSQYQHQVTSSNPEEENQPNASSATCTPGFTFDIKLY